MQDHPITWTAPEPLWTESANHSVPDRAPMSAPSILRFTTDDFMQQFTGLLATDPQRLGEFRVVNETWRGVFTSPVPPTPKKLFALPFQRLAATRLRINGSAPAGQGAKPTPNPDAANFPLKLYQPAQQRFYLATSCLVCQVPGLPDRTVDAGKQQRVGFVIRRLLPATVGASPAFNQDWTTTWQEHAWVTGASGNRWLPATSPDSFVDGEEVLPMFGLNYTQDDQRQRRLFAGLIPVAKRDAYLAGLRGPPNPAADDSLTARKILLRTTVIEPWKQLLDRAAKAYKAALSNDDPTAAPDANAIKRARVAFQVPAYFILLDFADFLRNQLKPVWDVLVGAQSSASLTDSKQNDALDALNSITVNASLRGIWSGLAPHQTRLASLPEVFAALNADATNVTALDSSKTDYDPSTVTGIAGYPPFVFPLADPADGYSTTPPTVSSGFPHLSAAQQSAAGTDPDLSDQVQLDLPDNAGLPDTSGGATVLDELAVILSRALPTVTSSAPAPAIPLAAKQVADALQGYFVLRCVYLRPGCGPLADDVVSDASEPFQLAGFFDPDAPARPIRIGLPIDTSPAGLRKFDKNTAFVLSDMLCGHAKRAKGMGFVDLVLSVLPFPFHKDLDGGNAACQGKDGSSLGTICSLSIPIITICAFILLIIMISLFDIIFSWMPYFMLCFPVKGLDGKKN